MVLPGAGTHELPPPEFPPVAGGSVCLVVGAELAPGAVTPVSELGLLVGVSVTPPPPGFLVVTGAAEGFGFSVCLAGGAPGSTVLVPFEGLGVGLGGGVLVGGTVGGGVLVGGTVGGGVLVGGTVGGGVLVGGTGFDGVGFGFGFSTILTGVPSGVRVIPGLGLGISLAALTGAWEYSWKPQRICNL